MNGTVEQWAEAFDRSAVDWQRLRSRRSLEHLARWELLFDEYVLTQQDLRNRGQWLSGPADMLSIIVFYLERQKQIEQWANLRKEAAKAAHRFFSSLADELSKLAGRLEGSPQFMAWSKEKWPRLFFFRSTWCQEGHRYPRVAIGLEWLRNTTLFDGSWVVVWVNSKSQGHEGLVTSLKQLTEEERRIRGLKSIPAWPVYQKENPLRSDYWNDLDGFREMIVRDVEDF